MYEVVHPVRRQAENHGLNSLTGSPRKLNKTAMATYALRAAAIRLKAIRLDMEINVPTSAMLRSFLTQIKPSRRFKKRGATSSFVNPPDRVRLRQRKPTQPCRHAVP